MIIWAILILNTLAAAIGVAFAGANDQLMRELRVENRARMGRGQAVVLSLAALAVVVLWTVYAFQVHDWRFAAITGVPFVLGWIGRSAAKAKAKREDAPVRRATVVRR